MYRRIVVPLDGSPLAEQAVPAAEELSRLTGAPLHVVRITAVVKPGQFGVFTALEAAAYAEVVSTDDAESAAYLDEMRTRLSARGLTVTTELGRGDPARELIALMRPDDVIVMATHGRGGVGRALIGSVADEVVRRSSVPILLVRATGENERRPQPTDKERSKHPKHEPAAALTYEPW
jgi:nucleotide-binding universal stress UspA family protein